MTLRLCIVLICVGALAVCLALLCVYSITRPATGHLWSIRAREDAIGATFFWSVVTAIACGMVAWILWP